MYDDLKLITGNSNKTLAKAIAKKLGVELTDTQVSRFSDGEIRVKINENIRGKEVFVVQSTHPPAENLLELLIMLDAVRRASAEKITAVIPYFGYGRQDRKDQPRVPVTAKLIANLVTEAGADRVLTIDLHAGQIQGFFDIPVDHLFGSQILLDYFKRKRIKNVVMVSPDVGGIKVTRSCAKRMGSSLALIDKRRPAPNESEVMNVIGEIKDKNALIIDDLVDTAGTLTEAASALIENGAKSVRAGATHPVLSGNAIERLEKSPIEKLIVTDTVPLPKEKRIHKIEILTVSDILAEAIKRIHEEKSISILFEPYD